MYLVVSSILQLYSHHHPQCAEGDEHRGPVETGMPDTGARVVLVPENSCLISKVLLRITPCVSNYSC